MTRPVSIVVPALDDIDLLRANLPRLWAELDRRDRDDEVVVVDDTGEGVLSEALAREFPRVRRVEREENGGYARALLDGMRAARHDLAFSMNPDVRVRAGFLDPLVAALDDPEVAAATPKVLLEGRSERVESITELDWQEGMLSVRQPGLEGDAGVAGSGIVNVAFAVGGTCLLRREEFLASGGFDPLYHPFYWEDVDWCWSAWRSGRRVVCVLSSVVEHHHRGTIGRRVPAELVRAAQEKNRLLFHWKHLDSRSACEDHVAALYRLVVDSWLEERREDLIWLALALDELDAVLAARKEAPEARRRFEEVLALARVEPREPPRKRGRRRSKKRG